MNTGNTFFNGVVHFNLEIIILNIKKFKQNKYAYINSDMYTLTFIFGRYLLFKDIYVDLFLLDY